jgi:putative transposase
MSGDRYKIADQEAPYFVTFTIVNWIDVFTRKDYKLIITDSLNYCIENKGLEVFAWVIMSNHVHLIVSGKTRIYSIAYYPRFQKVYVQKNYRHYLEIGESRREWLLDKFSFEARRTQRAKNYKVWTDDNHAILLENAKWMQQRLNYIHDNPVRQLIVQHPHEYIFSSAMDYADEKGLVNIVKI